MGLRPGVVEGGGGSMVAGREEASSPGWAASWGALAEGSPTSRGWITVCRCPLRAGGSPAQLAAVKQVSSYR